MQKPDKKDGIVDKKTTVSVKRILNMHVWSTCRTCFQLRIYVLHPKVHQTSRIAIAVILTNARAYSTIFKESYIPYTMKQSPYNTLAINMCYTYLVNHH